MRNTLLNIPTRKNEKGFTVVELLIAMLIISIIAAIAIPTFLTYTENSRKNSMKTDVANTNIALTSLYAMKPNPTEQEILNIIVSTDNNIITITGDKNTYTICATNPATEYSYGYSRIMNSYVENCLFEENNEGGDNNGGETLPPPPPPYIPMAATGGYVDYYEENGETYKVHYFTNLGNNTFTVTDLGDSNGEIEYLIVGGGGGGSRGGGGAGGVITGTTSITPETYTITVGAGGGAGALSTLGGSGQNSSAFTLTAIGGGGGGYGVNNGLSGGSGGGAGAHNSGNQTGGAGTEGQGFAGGNKTHSSSPFPSAGGGGATAEGGSTINNTTSGAGGAGIELTITGNPTFFAGGGGGANFSNSGTHGVGGSGVGGTPNISRAISSGKEFTGSGGAGQWNGGTAGLGAHGIVIIKYLYSPLNLTTNIITEASENITDTNIWTHYNVASNFPAETEPRVRLINSTTNTVSSVVKTSPLTNDWDILTVEADVFLNTSGGDFFALGLGQNAANPLGADKLVVYGNTTPANNSLFTVAQIYQNDKIMIGGSGFTRQDYTYRLIFPSSTWFNIKTKYVRDPINQNNIMVQVYINNQLAKKYSVDSNLDKTSSSHLFASAITGAAVSPYDVKNFKYKTEQYIQQ
jgi:prepilin-type N-terminal cleavage/methylation domain-containing protein